MMEQANNISSYLKLIDRYKDYSEKYYRGQLEKYKTIPPSISRELGYLKNESSIYHESISLKKDEFSDFSTPLERLSKLQHYGIPTRLVDMTVDPLVALYFAVEDVDSLSSGNVYLYLSGGHAVDSIKARVLSILPTVPQKNVVAIAREYEALYSESITTEEILTYISTPAIIQFFDMLKGSNPRLHSQKGTFLICGNDVVDGNITDTLASLDTFTPAMVIRIPYEYKKSIKNELDAKHNINMHNIYPELPSVAAYIKEKYKEENISLDGKYSIVETGDISTGITKRVSVTIVLNEQLPISQIKSIAIDVIEQYKEAQNVIWVYVARSGEDYIVSNWILRGQWIDSSIDNHNRPLPLKEPGGDGYSWDSHKSYSTLSDYYDEYIFDDDNALFVYHKKTWERFLPIYNELLTCFANSLLSEFTVKVAQCEKEISKIYSTFQNFGRSRNKVFDDFLSVFTYAIIPIDDLHIWLNSEKISEKTKQRRIKQSFQEAESNIRVVNLGIPEWETKLRISQNDYHNFDPDNQSRPKYTYRPTLPISKDAIDVKFEIIPVIHTNKTVHIEGTTNLFNCASLMLSVRNNEGLFCQTKTDVQDGHFSFQKLSNNGKGLNPGVYSGEISLSIPSVQLKEFTRFAGIEYENLTGSFISRSGIAPSGKIGFSFSVE